MHDEKAVVLLTFADLLTLQTREGPFFRLILGRQRLYDVGMKPLELLLVQGYQPVPPLCDAFVPIGAVEPYLCGGVGREM